MPAPLRRTNNPHRPTTPACPSVCATRRVQGVSARSPPGPRQGIPATPDPVCQSTQPTQALLAPANPVARTPTPLGGTDPAPRRCSSQATHPLPVVPASLKNHTWGRASPSASPAVAILQAWPPPRPREPRPSPPQIPPSGLGGEGEGRCLRLSPPWGPPAPPGLGTAPGVPGEGGRRGPAPSACTPPLPPRALPGAGLWGGRSREGGAGKRPLHCLPLARDPAPAGRTPPPPVRPTSHPAPLIGPLPSQWAPASRGCYPPETGLRRGG